MRARSHTGMRIFVASGFGHGATDNKMAKQHGKLTIVIKKPLLVSEPWSGPVGMQTEYVPTCLPTLAVIDFMPKGKGYHG